MSFSFNFQLDEEQPQEGEGTKSNDLNNGYSQPDSENKDNKTNICIREGVQNLNLDVDGKTSSSFEIEEDDTMETKKKVAKDELGGVSFEILFDEKSFDEQAFYWLDFQLKWDEKYGNKIKTSSAGKDKDIIALPTKENGQASKEDGGNEDKSINRNDIHFLIVDKDVREAIDDVGRGVDLVAGKYEGGFKIWEGTRDLLQFLQRSEISLEGKNFSTEVSGSEDIGDDLERPLNKLKKYTKIMDLGCGHGLLGLYALEKGAKNVTFTDYNRECLTDLTFPNVMQNYSFRESKSVEYNLHNEGHPNKDETSIRYYYGDWGDVSKLHLIPEEITYDLILSAETVYTQEVTLKVIKFLKSHLSYPTRSSSSSSFPSVSSRKVEEEFIENQEDGKTRGIALIAGKRYYFGTGGGTGYMMSLLKYDSELTGEVVASFENGQSNIREIVLVKRKLSSGNKG